VRLMRAWYETVNERTVNSAVEMRTNENKRRPSVLWRQKSASQRLILAVVVADDDLAETGRGKVAFRVQHSGYHGLCQLVLLPAPTYPTMAISANNSSAAAKMAGRHHGIKHVPASCLPHTFVESTLCLFVAADNRDRDGEHPSSIGDSESEQGYKQLWCLLKTVLGSRQLAAARTEQHGDSTNDELYEAPHYEQCDKTSCGNVTNER